MPTLPAVMVTLLLPFEHLFDPRTWRKAQLLAMGAILSPGKRTVSSALNNLGCQFSWSLGRRFVVVQRFCPVKWKAKMFPLVSWLRLRICVALSAWRAPGR